MDPMPAQARQPRRASQGDGHSPPGISGTHRRWDAPEENTNISLGDPGLGFGELLKDHQSLGIRELHTRISVYDHLG